MLSIFDAAKYILKKTGSISTWKLQKLCYYSQAWSLAWTEKPIFEEDFEAWANGPVSPVLFSEHRGQFVIDNISRGDIRNLNADQKETIDIVVEKYGKYSPYELREMTHEESPWKEARKGYSDGQSCNVIITKESMGLYYGGL